MAYNVVRPDQVIYHIVISSVKHGLHWEGQVKADGNVNEISPLIEMTEGERNRISVFSLKQDARLLQNNIILTGIGFLKQIMEKHNFLVSDFDYFMPHMSSMFFKKKIYKGLKERGIHIPYEMWFTNLVKIGNIGAASSFFMIEELFNSGNLKKGEKMLVMVPESARFSYAYMMLKVV